MCDNVHVELADARTVLGESPDEANTPVVLSADACGVSDCRGEKNGRPKLTRLRWRYAERLKASFLAPKPDDTLASQNEPSADDDDGDYALYGDAYDAFDAFSDVVPAWLCESVYEYSELLHVYGVGDASFASFASCSSSFQPGTACECVESHAAPEHNTTSPDTFVSSPLL